MKKKTVVLHRVSTDNQDFESQDNAIQEYVIRNEIIVDEYITEHGVSGYSNKLYEREAIRKIEEMALLGELDTLIVFNLDRIGRNTEVSEFIKQLTYCNVKVISVTEGLLNSGNDYDELINYIKSFTAQMESKKISVRSKNGIASANKRGLYQGGLVTYGYKVVNKKLVIVDEEAEIIRLVFDLYNKVGKNQTVRYLRENNIKKRDNQFSHHSVNDLLKETAYIGLKRYGHYVRVSNDPTVNKRKIDYSQSKYQPYDESIRIVSDDLFYETQQKMEGRRNKIGEDSKFTNRSKALFESLIYHRCGDGEIRKLHVDWKVDKYGNRITQYRCTHCKRNFYTNVTKNYGGKKLHKIIERMILEEVSNTSIIDLENRALSDKNNNEAIINNTIKQLEDTISKKGKALRNARCELEMIFMGESSMDKTTVNSIIIKLDKEINELKINLENNKNKLEESKVKVGFDKNLIDKYTNFCYAYNNANEQEKKQLLQEIVDRIVIDGEEVNIQLYSL